jgi:MFS family permease
MWGTRWAVLALSCVTMAGVMFAYDTPAALERQMKGDLKLSNTQFNAFYTAYSLPNVVLPFFGGLLVDTYGAGRTMAVFVGLVVAGHGLFVAGFALRRYWVAVLGRVLFGFGGESLAVAQSALLALWFQGKETALAMGVSLSVSRLGSVANDQVSPAVFASSGLDAALWTALAVVAVSAMAALVLAQVSAPSAAAATVPEYSTWMPMFSPALMPLTTRSGRSSSSA